MVHPFAVDVSQKHVSFEFRKINALFLAESNLLFKKFFCLVRHGLHEAFEFVFMREFFRNERGAFGEKSLLERAVERIVIPVIGRNFGVVIIANDFSCDWFEHIDNLRMNVYAVKHLVPLFVNDFALFVHNVVVIQYVFADCEVAAFNHFLRAFDLFAYYAVGDCHIFVDVKHFGYALKFLAAEYSRDVVLKRYIEYRTALVSLSSGTTSQLIVDTTAFVSFRTDYSETARGDYFFFFLVAHLFESVVVFLIFVAQFQKCGVVDFHKRSRNFDIFDGIALFFEFLFGKIFGIAPKHNIGASACHIRCNRYRTDSSRLSYYIRFHFVVFGVEYVMINAFPV